MKIPGGVGCLLGGEQGFGGGGPKFFFFGADIPTKLDVRGEKGTQTQTFWSGYFRWGGGLPREWVGAKKFGMSLETQGNHTFGRDIPGFCWDIPGVPRKFEKERFVFDSRPLRWAKLCDSYRRIASESYRCDSNPCPSFPCFFGKRQGKPPQKQGFCIPTEPLKSLEKKGKTPKKTRNFLAGEKAKEVKKTRMDRDH